MKNTMMGNKSSPKATMSNNMRNSTTLTATVVTSRDDLDTYAREWNELLSSSDANTIFLTWEWISTWLDTVYQDARLLVVLVHDADRRLIGVGPFYLSSMRAFKLLTLKCLRVLGDSQSGAEYGDLIIRNGWEEPAIEAISSCLAEAHDEWDCFWSPSVAGWTGARDRWMALFGKLSTKQVWKPGDFSFIRLPDTYEKYLEELPGKARRETARLRRRLESMGTVEFRQCRGQAEVSSQLTVLYDLHRRRWQQVGQEGSFARRPKLAEFNNQFAPIAFSRGWLRLSVLYVTERPAAALFGCLYNGVGCGLQCGFDTTVNGAGRVLWGEVLCETIAAGAAEYDFLRGLYEYTQYLGGGCRTGYQVFAGRRSLKNRLVFWPGLWPYGRYIRQGPPESFGRGHD